MNPLHFFLINLSNSKAREMHRTYLFDPDNDPARAAAWSSLVEFQQESESRGFALTTVEEWSYDNGLKFVRTIL